MNKKYLLTICIILIVLVGGIVVWKGINTTKQTNIAIKHTTALPKEATVTLGKDGFSPKEVTIKIGGAIRWKNESGKPETVNSDDYPTNQLHKELNFGLFNNGSSVIYTFTKPGTYGYHNQLHHEQEGKIIVTK